MLHLARFSRFTIVAAILLACLASPSTSQAAMFQGLGDLPGGSVSSNAYAISADGSTVVGDSASANGTEAFRWTRDGGMQPLGLLSGGGTTAFGVNADGSVIVGRSSPTNQPFRWTSAGGMENLVGMPFGTAWGVSGDGSIIAGDTTSPNANRAFRWSAGGGAELLADAPGGSLSSRAFAISRDGSIIAGSASVTGPVLAPALWRTADGSVTPLTLPPETGAAMALAISADNTTIVGSLRTVSHKEAFRWTASTGIELLDVPESGTISNAYAVSGDGSTVVGNGLEAMIWDADHGPRPLKNLLQTTYGLNLSGWTLTVARGISQDGNTIVGLGKNPAGYTEAWIAQLPEPDGAIIVFVMLAQLGCRGYSRRVIRGVPS